MTTSCQWFVKGIEKEGEQNKDIKLLMNDSQNDQSNRTTRSTYWFPKVKALAINLADPAAAPVVIEKAKRKQHSDLFYNKEPTKEALDSYDKALLRRYWTLKKPVLSKAISLLNIGKASPRGIWTKTAWLTIMCCWKANQGILTLKHVPLMLLKHCLKTTRSKLMPEYGYRYVGYRNGERQKLMHGCSGSNGEKIEVVIANNDGMAMGAVEALKKN